MKSLNSFMINEGRPKKVKDAPEFDEVSGKKAQDTDGSGVRWSLNEPTDDSVAKEAKKLDKTTFRRNEKNLYSRLKTKKPFFILGEAGWGKTSMIENFAEAFNLNIITVYLDKAVASDLGGIPVPEKDKDGTGFYDNLMPHWAKIMWQNPDKNFLLFFDEMNQAAPDVMNALMPIVLRHEICNREFKNIWCVGAAGNYERENQAVSKMSGPLESRFKPIIIWETGTDDAWNSTFNYLHKKLDNKYGKELIDLAEDNKELFENPREIEQKFIEYFAELHSDIDDLDGWFDPEFVQEYLEDLCKKDCSRSKLTHLGDKIYEWTITPDDQKTQNSGRRQSKNNQQVSEELLNFIKQMMKDGYIQVEGDSRKFGVSKENIADVVDMEECNMEMLERIIRRFEEEGIKWKHETDEDWKSKPDKFSDPNSFDFATGKFKYKKTKNFGQNNEPTTQPKKKSLKQYAEK